LGQIQNLEDLINFLQRRFWLILGISVLGVAMSALYAKSRPDTFEASAVIEVQGAQIAGTEASGSAQLLQSIEQRLTTRENLQAVIDRHGLYADLPGLSYDERINLLRQSVTFLPIAAAGANPYAGPAQISAIVILARDGDAALSARVANDFAQGVLDLSSTGTLDKARDTMAFYLDEEARLTAQINALETRVADYKNANELAVPGVADSLRDESENLDTDVRALDQSLVALIEEQRQLAEKGNLRSTEKRRLQELDAEIAVLVEQKSALTTRQEELDAQIARLPEVDRALAGFERELAQLQGSLQLVAAKLTEAETEAKLAERQQTERFALLERALTPEYPMGSGGKKLFVAGAVASLMAAVGLAFVLDLLKPVIRTSAQMERQLGLRPIVAIPDLELPGRPGRKTDAAKVKEKVLAMPTAVLVCSGLTAVLFVAAALS
jgi:tyrosine-protein kinase Etk/Wzc